MALSPPANTEIATRQDLALASAELRAHTWKVVVGTGVGLYLMLAGTMVAGFRFLG